VRDSPFDEVDISSMYALHSKYIFSGRVQDRKYIFVEGFERISVNDTEEIKSLLLHPIVNTMHEIWSVFNTPHST
jgi:hypothetical protein